MLYSVEASILSPDRVLYYIENGKNEIVTGFSKDNELYSESEKPFSICCMSPSVRKRTCSDERMSPNVRRRTCIDCIMSPNVRRRTFADCIMSPNVRRRTWFDSMMSPNVRWRTCFYRMMSSNVRWGTYNEMLSISLYSLSFSLSSGLLFATVLSPKWVYSWIAWLGDMMVSSR